ncbi:MAG: bifunctional folylpolyglutamate synthase/dihydrofolate synthase [Candidatus Altiarchaeota archaeon]|nr:bifunctional folylpolyglutamate synthase/dihydrofolate synthase [Candidatus Altiarchaeota archaeon]
MNYMQAVAFLYGLRESRVKLRLEHTRELLSMLGNPESKLRFVHVAGTNGKGSVCAMVSSVLSCEGYRTGLFISPHLNRFEERISIDGVFIGEDEVVALVERVMPFVDEMKESGRGPTFFEVVTAMALSYFAEKNADIVVLEVGLGGRLDATNVVEPIVSVITNIALDHQRLLGNSIEEIAREKAGIVKRGGILVTGAEGNSLDIIREECARNNSELVLVGKDIRYEKVNSSGEGQKFRLNGICDYGELGIPLLGEHQIFNAAVAVGAIEALKKRGVSVDEKSVRQGLEEAAWPGRLEIVRKDPLVILDGAHNPAGIRALKKCMEGFDYERLILVIGISKGKAVPEMVGEISALADIIIVTRFEGNSTEPELIAEEFTSGGKDVVIKNKIPNAVSYAVDEARDEDLVLITGSLFTVGEARRFLLGKDVE